MQRSSESIASLAAALAKAQIETEQSGEVIGGDHSRRWPRRTSERAFRYAPLSSGLDIVRKDPGAACDRYGADHCHRPGRPHRQPHDPCWRILSGEWIRLGLARSAPSAKTATPRRMGAALTTRRRYALFTLVGICGRG